MKIASSIFGCLILLAFSQTSASAYLDLYTPIDKTDARAKVKVQPFNDLGLKDGKILHLPQGSEISLNEETELVITGKDKSGKKWSIIRNYYGLGNAIFTKDLDKNGIVDILLIQANGACGIAPPMVLTTILFDGKGRPFCTEFRGYFCDENPDARYDTTGKPYAVPDLITLPGDQRPVVVCNQLEMAEVGKRYKSYFRTIMYRLDQGGWQRLASYRGRKLPFLVRYTYKPNKKIIPPPIPALKQFDDGAYGASDRARCKTARLTNAKIGNRGYLESLELDGKELCNHALFTSFLIVEGGGDLEILELESDAGAKVLQGLVEKRATIRYLPSDLPSRIPVYIWATK